MQSMTGYGLFSSKYESSILEFEVKSINSKFLKDLNIKSNLDSIIPEKEIRKLSSRINRKRKSRSRN